MTRVLVISNDVVGSQMAGPAIRYVQLARHLSRRFDVTLVVPTTPDVSPPGIEIVVEPDPDRAGRLGRRYDVAVTQVLSISAMNALARSDTRTIFDLYVPFMIENLGFFADQADPTRREFDYRLTNHLQDTALRTGDAFICASERQRDLWLGYLGARGRIGLPGYIHDPDFSELVRVVPFGLDPSPPQHTKQVLKGVVPGIREDDRVLLWGGGIWNWFDPLTLIRAVGQLARTRDDVKLYFLGVTHPNPSVPAMSMAVRAVELSKELGLLDRHVFFNLGWVPYDERHNYLLEADIGVSTHFDTIETRYAFRTRMLDYFWAGRPIVATGGDTLADLVATRELGLTVRAGDPQELADAITRLLDDDDRYRQAQTNVMAIRNEYSWPVVVSGLAELIDATAGQSPTAPSRFAKPRHLSLVARNVYRQSRVRRVITAADKRRRDQSTGRTAAR